MSKPIAKLGSFYCIRGVVFSRVVELCLVGGNMSITVVQKAFQIRSLFVHVERLIAQVLRVFQKVGFASMSVRK